ncbi:hypothetical protein BT96DRAFT_1012743 [Gymnopus androsaceus JB14]|uniref:Uncharacterized protein n=1 Tax=Gymnopus androsaceus JB14 TaxID=1447944 RepID=A0A6A4IKZ4_9AGAR|nr:hypothetical protein BT96DRAFT_1012743 [Gymnopus androsaceus JB14]
MNLRHIFLLLHYHLLRNIYLLDRMLFEVRRCLLPKEGHRELCTFYLNYFMAPRIQ